MSDNGFPDLAAWLDKQAAIKRSQGSPAEYVEKLTSCANHIRSLRKEIETLSDRLQELESSRRSEV